MRRRCYLFGPYRLDAVARTVLRDNKPVALAPKAVETLAVLVENRGQVVAKDTLLSRVWAGTFVGDGSLMRNISDLRRVLAHDGQPDYIDTIPRRGYRFNADVREVEYAVEPHRRSIAVLPLRTVGGSARDRTVGDAVVEAVVTKLSSVRECAVQSAAAIRRHPGDDPVAIGRELQVEFVLDGSLRRNASKARVSVRLLPTSGGAPLWAETLEEGCRDLFAFEDSISDELAGAAALVLTSAERKLLARRYTENVAAYQAYLKGRLYWARRSEEGLHRALDQFRRAIDIDPDYALAHSALASSYALMPMLAPVASATFMPRAKAAAVRALEIDDTLIEARSVLAFVKWHYDWDWRGAERELRRILKFEPEDAVSHVWYALLLAERGESTKAMAQARRAQALDPASGSIRANVATVLCFCGRFGEAVEEARNALAADPGSLRAHHMLGLALEQQGWMDEAVAALETAVTISRGTHPAVLGALGHAYARSGQRGAADKVLRTLAALPAEVTGASEAVVRLALGSAADALRSLRRACDSREFYLVMLGVDRRLDPLRGLAGFRGVLERVGLAG